MAKYTVNLGPVWNLPAGPGAYRNPDNTYCAIGLIMAGTFGAENVAIGSDFEDSHPCSLFQEDLNSIRISITWAMRNFDIPIHGGENKEAVRERCVRQILQKGMEAGLFELADADLQIVRDLKAAQAKDLVA